LAKYEYGCVVTSVSVEGQHVVVKYTDREKKVQTARTDRVFAADGPSSSVRSQLALRAKRSYAGYVFQGIHRLIQVAWRGTVPETEVSQATSDALVEKFTFFHSEGIQVYTLNVYLTRSYRTLSRERKARSNVAKDSSIGCGIMYTFLNLRNS
jgi:2-polyprenyl-6-methoxyphenol hydroxylase-like FAD-dependent oxidoreductase